MARAEKPSPEPFKRFETLTKKLPTVPEKEVDANGDQRSKRKPKGA